MGGDGGVWGLKKSSSKLIGLNSVLKAIKCGDLMPNIDGSKFQKLQHSTEIEAEETLENTPGGMHVTRVSAEKTLQGNEGIRVRTSSGFGQHRPGIWIPKKIDIDAWLKRISAQIKKLSEKYLGKRVEITQDVVDEYKFQIEKLTKDLAEMQLKKENIELQLENKERIIKLAQELVDNIEAYQNNLNDLRTAVVNSKNNDVRNENEVKKILSGHRWLLGIDCEVKAKEQRTDNQGGIDLHVQTELKQDKIFEFKSPNIPLFEKTRETSRLKITKDMADGINQLIQYLRKTDIYSSLAEEGTYKVQKSLGIIVMGYNLPKDEITLIKEWNFHLRPHLRIITYDELIENAERQLENIKFARERKISS